MGMDEAAVDVGAVNAMWIVILTWFTGGSGVMMAGLIAGKTGAEMNEPLKMGIICSLLMGLCGIGWIMAMCIACKTKAKSTS